MKFEGEESPEQRFTGTIVGIDDVNPDRWQDSEWRRLKVRWDENSSIRRPERVSHWNVEPASALPMNPVAMSRSKRPRTNARVPFSDSSLLSREAVHKVVAGNSSQPPGISKTLHCQEINAGSSKDSKNNEFDPPKNAGIKLRALDCDDNNVDSTDATRVQDGWKPGSGGQGPACRDMLSRFHAQGDAHCFKSSFDQTSGLADSQRNHYAEQENKLSPLGLGCPQQATSSLVPLSTEPGSKMASQAGNITPYLQSGSSYDIFRSYHYLQGQDLGKCLTNWTPHKMHPPLHFQTTAHPFTIKPQPNGLQADGAVNKANGNLKIFGIDFISNFSVPEADSPSTSTFRKWYPNSCELALRPPTNGEKSAGVPSVSGSQDGKCLKSCSQPSTRVQGRLPNVSARSCTKVQKQGSALGRSVDLTKFNGYDELIEELDRMFDFQGELIISRQKWLVVYTDNEGDMMLVGDDPWQEFCSMVCKISIYTREEVLQMNAEASKCRLEERKALEGEPVTENKSCVPSESNNHENM